MSYLLYVTLRAKTVYTTTGSGNAFIWMHSYSYGSVIVMDLVHVFTKVKVKHVNKYRSQPCELTLSL